MASEQWNVESDVYDVVRVETETKVRRSKETSRKGTSRSTSSRSRVSYIVCIERYESTGTSGTHSLRGRRRRGKGVLRYGYVVIFERTYRTQHNTTQTDFLVGRVCEDTELRKWTAGDRATLVADMVRVLAELHNQDFEKLGLENHGKRGHYGKRQLKTWGQQFERGIPSIEANVHKHDKARLVLDYNEKMRKLIRRLQIASEKIGECTTLVHGDYRIGNLMLRPEDPRILAVLDWEISTLGHPICDLAYVVSFFF